MASYSVCVYTAVIVEHEHHHGPAVLVRRPLRKTFQVHAKRRQVRGRQSLKPERAKCGKKVGFALVIGTIKYRSSNVFNKSVPTALGHVCSVTDSLERCKLARRFMLNK
jgi:hypothetical protein